MDTGELLLLIGYSVIYTLGILGNGLVCYVIKKYQSMRNVTNFLLLNLAMSDFLSSFTGCLVLLFQYKVISHPTGRLGDIFCKFLTSGTISYVSIQISELTLCVIAIDRYFAICHPLKSKYRLKKEYLKVLLPSLWLFGIATYSQYIAVTRGNHGLPCYDGYPSEAAGITIAVVDFTMYCAIPLLVFLFSYLSIGVAIWKPKIIDVAMTANNGRRRRQVKTTRILISVTILFCICVVPSYVHLLYQVITSNKFTLKYNFYLFLLHMHSSVNPFIYILRSEQFQRAFRNIYRWRNHLTVVSDNSYNAITEGNGSSFKSRGTTMFKKMVPHISSGIIKEKRLFNR